MSCLLVFFFQFFFCVFFFSWLFSLCLFVFVLVLFCFSSCCVFFLCLLIVSWFLSLSHVVFIVALFVFLYCFPFCVKNSLKIVSSFFFWFFFLFLCFSGYLEIVILIFSNILWSKTSCSYRCLLSLLSLFFFLLIVVFPNVFVCFTSFLSLSSVFVFWFPSRRFDFVGLFFFAVFCLSLRCCMFDDFISLFLYCILGVCTSLVFSPTFSQLKLYSFVLLHGISSLCSLCFYAFCKFSFFFSLFTNHFVFFYCFFDFSVCFIVLHDRMFLYSLNFSIMYFSNDSRFWLPHVYENTIWRSQSIWRNVWYVVSKTDAKEKNSFHDDDQNNIYIFWIDVYYASSYIIRMTSIILRRNRHLTWIQINSVSWSI